MLAGPPWNRRGQHPPVDARPARRPRAGGIQAAVARFTGGRGAPAAVAPHRLPSPSCTPNALPLQPAGSKPPSPGLPADEGPQPPSPLIACRRPPAPPTHCRSSRRDPSRRRPACRRTRGPNCRKAGHPGGVTRLLICAEDQLPFYRGLRIGHTLQVPSYSGHPCTGDWFGEASARVVSCGASKWNVHFWVVACTWPLISLQGWCIG